MDGKGFTLIELLIVIAIIGILSAVLIPSLLGARLSAQEKTAQAYSTQIYQVVGSYLAASPSKKPSDANSADCTGYISFTSDDGTQYGHEGATGYVNSCQIVGNNANGQILVQVVSSNGKTYINGILQ